MLPLRVRHPDPWLEPTLAQRLHEDDLLVECGIYGLPNTDPDTDVSEVLEEAIVDLDGVKTLSGRNHYTPDTFWGIYDESAYRRAKERLDPSYLFRDLYDKLGRG